MAKYNGFCGYSTDNKGAYNQHVRDCERCRRAYEGDSRWDRLGRKLQKFGGEAHKASVEKDLGLGSGRQLSRCCYEGMEFDKKKRLMVCKKCGKSSWEVK
jgi:hypothetical protein